MSGHEDNRGGVADIDTEPCLQALEDQLAKLETERTKLLRRIEVLRREPLAADTDRPEPTQRPLAESIGTSDRAAHLGLVTHDSPPDDKVALFADLFRGRPDVYAVRWESRRSGRLGFQPACANEWSPTLCDKRHVRCSACPNRELLPLTPEILHDHLRGRRDLAGDREFVVGVYPLLEDETCRFVAIDLDGAAWDEDASALLAACRTVGVPGALERSR
jgi:hypothetical protein